MNSKGRRVRMKLMAYGTSPLRFRLQSILTGRVRLAEHATTGQPAAVKIVPRHLLASSRMSLGEMSQKQDKLTLGIEREIVIMKLIEHPNLLGLWDVYETTKEL